MNLARERSSLPRVLEPEVMDSAADADDYDSMDHGEVNRRFVADFLAACESTGIARDAVVLDLGTGTAQIPIELCRQSPQAQIVAIDLAEHMLALARRNVEAAGLAAQIRLQRVDAKGLPFADREFAAVMSNSIMHHIPEPPAALSEVVRVVARSGLIFVRDLARPFDEAEVQRLVSTYAGDCNEHQRQLFDDSLRAALSLEEIRELVEELGFDSMTVEATSDRHWTWSARVPK